MEEDAALLKKYAETLGYDWHIAVAPLLVARALGNLYSAQYLNPPVSPMLVIDRNGQVLGLPFGLKSAEQPSGGGVAASRSLTQGRPDLVRSPLADPRACSRAGHRAPGTMAGQGHGARRTMRHPALDDPPASSGR